VLSESPKPEPPRKGRSASAAFQRLGCRVIEMATAKNDIFAITINDDAIGGIVLVDLERGASAAGYGRCAWVNPREE